ncbi:hypothetical protein MG296_13290 [Flavobacteriaceae bacterium TK19130]|nr:hypothetical protein [Thermobacterium salinum]
MKPKKHTHGFSVPKDYFESFDERLQERLTESALPTAHGFEVPVGYFDSLEDRIKVPSKPPKVRRLSNFAVWSTVASAAAVIALVFWLHSSEDGTSLDTVPLASIESYLEEELIDYDISEIATELTEAEISTTFSETSLPADQVQQYLLMHVEEIDLSLE